MVEREAVVKSRHGLHARPSANISKYASKLRNTSVKIVDPETETEADARSIMSLLCMELLQSKRVVVIADGEQEKEAAETIAEIINTFDV